MAKPKKGGLGKGLDVLFVDNDTTDNGILNLRVSDIEPNRDQPRRHFDEAALAELADSIQQHGVLQPLVVRPLPGGGYQIVAGERRWRASRMAGLSEVPAIVRDMSDSEVMEIALIENLQREDLNIMEEAAGYHALMEEYDMTQDQVASRVGKSRSAVANALRLLNLPDDVAAMVREGKLSAGHARALLPLSPAQQAEAVKAILANALSVRQTEQLVKRLLNKQEKPEKEKNPTAVDYVAVAERELSDSIGRACHIAHGKKKGRIEIEYYGVDDLNDLLEALHKLGK
jgi:ParB family chromosome partitioning protein